MACFATKVRHVTNPTNWTEPRRKSNRPPNAIDARRVAPYAGLMQHSNWLRLASLMVAILWLPHTSEAQCGCGYRPICEAYRASPVVVAKSVGNQLAVSEVLHGSAPRNIEWREDRREPTRSANTRQRPKLDFPTQNPVGFTPRVGSIPISGTN